MPVTAEGMSIDIDEPLSESLHIDKGVTGLADVEKATVIADAIMVLPSECLDILVLQRKST